MRSGKYYADFCPQFKDERKIYIEFEEDFKIMFYECPDFGDCEQVSKFGDCPIYLKLVKKLPK